MQALLGHAELHFEVLGDIPREPRALTMQRRWCGAGHEQPQPLPGLTSTAWLGRINK